MKETENTPKVNDFDDSFLVTVNENINNSFSRLTIADFKKYWAERLFANPEEDKTDYLREWEYNVALGRNVPVFITDENGEDTWLFPPLMGSIKSRWTANQSSMNTLRSQAETLKRRITRIGLAAEDAIYSYFSPDAEDKTFADINIFMLRRECGYITKEDEANFQALISKVAPAKSSVVESPKEESEEDYDY